MIGPQTALCRIPDGKEAAASISTSDSCVLLADGAAPCERTGFPWDGGYILWDSGVSLHSERQQKPYPGDLTPQPVWSQQGEIIAGRRATFSYHPRITFFEKNNNNSILLLNLFHTNI